MTTWKKVPNIKMQANPPPTPHAFNFLQECKKGNFHSASESMCEKFFNRSLKHLKHEKHWSSTGLIRQSSVLHVLFCFKRHTGAVKKALICLLVMIYIYLHESSWLVCVQTRETGDFNSGQSQPDIYLLVWFDPFKFPTTRHIRWPKCWKSLTTEKMCF